MRTAEFRDINKNGIDDRDEDTTQIDRRIRTTGVEGVRTPGSFEIGGRSDENPVSGNQSGVDQTQRGFSAFQDLMDKFFTYKPDKDDDLGRDLKLGFAADQTGKRFDTELSKEMADFQSGLYKDNALFGADLELRNQRDARADEFGYGMRGMDKQFELQDEFQNRQFGRNVGMLQATGEQSRKNMRAQGVENRLGQITAGEQERLGIAARGDQDRRGYRVLGEENRAQIRTQGKEDRRLVRTQGRDNRETIDFTDKVLSRKEGRAADRSLGLARAF